MPSKCKLRGFSPEKSVDASISSSFSFRKFLFCLWPGKQESGSSIVGTFRSQHFLPCSFQLLTMFTQGILKASCMALEALKCTPPIAQSEPVAIRLVAWAGHTQCVQILTVRNWATSWKIKLPFIKGKKGKRKKHPTWSTTPDSCQPIVFQLGFDLTPFELLASKGMYLYAFQIWLLDLKKNGAHGTVLDTYL